MRIRSIKPEFWRSEDVARLAWPDRLLFIGLWSYVDDNGVGRDLPKVVVADLFALEEDPRDTLATVSRGLASLAAAGLIARYEVDGKPYLHITTWDTHQRIDRPNRPRYPLPTCGNAVTRDTLATPSRAPRDTLAPGAVEQGNRGTGEKDSSSPAAPSTARSTAGSFETFWDTYPRKVGKTDARKAFDTAARRVGPEPIVLGAKRLAADPNLPERQFIPHPATWLRRGGWDDEPLPPPAGGRPADQPTAPSPWDRRYRTGEDDQ